MFMEIDPAALEELEKHPELLEPPPLASAAERATYNVELGTEILYRLHLELEKHFVKAAGKPLPPAVDITNDLFMNGCRTWWAMTGGWENVDRSVRFKYPIEFVRHVVLINEQGKITKELIKALKNGEARQRSNASSSKQARSSPSTFQGPYDVVEATRKLFGIAQSAIRSHKCPSQKYEDLFDHFANIWCARTGGPDRVDKSILAPYPTWFIGKLGLFHQQQNKNLANCGSRVVKQPEFKAERDTLALFHLAKQRFPKAPQGMKDDCPSFELEVTFESEKIHWCQCTGGWDYVDKSIRDQFPKWFVDNLAETNKKLPLIKIVTYDCFSKRTIIKMPDQSG